ncbi:putative coiled-coil domain-containing protein 144C [Anas platyrhynchos]|uniref:putative coiled-coil domain-containing protein 144C n=1 Tax=Anas platyrhynchos TaxID=8839 RepID=UPI000F7C227E|eukprot:XP_027310070.1 CAP-Gly domain-containing linker protein 1-like [Anas platyrhynchos]
MASHSRTRTTALACNPWAAESRKMRETLLHAVRKGRKHPALAMGQELLKPDNVHPLWREQDTERTVETKSDLLAFSPSLRHQTSKSAAEQMFQRERELCLQEKLYRDISEMQESNKSLSQQLSKAERKASRLEKEVEQLKELLQEKTLFLQSAERTIEDVRKQAKKCHALCPQKAQLKKEAAEKEVLQEQLSQLQKTNLSLCQQLEGMRNKAIQETGAVTQLQEKLADTSSKLWKAKTSLLVSTYTCRYLEEENSKLQEDLDKANAKGRDLSAELEVQHELLLQLEDDKQKLQEQVASLKLQLETARVPERICHQRWSKERTQEMRQKQELSHLFPMPAVSRAKSEQINIQEMAVRKYQEQQIAALKSEVERTQSLQQETLLQLARVQAKIDRSDEQYLMQKDIRRCLTNKLNRANNLLADVSAEMSQEHLPCNSSVTKPTLRNTLKTGKDLLGTVTCEHELRSAGTSQITPGRSFKVNQVQVAPFNTTQSYPNGLNKEILN